MSIYAALVVVVMVVAASLGARSYTLRDGMFYLGFPFLLIVLLADIDALTQHTAQAMRASVAAGLLLSLLLCVALALPALLPGNGTTWYGEFSLTAFDLLSGGLLILLVALAVRQARTAAKSDDLS